MFSLFFSSKLHLMLLKFSEQVNTSFVIPKYLTVSSGEGSLKGEWTEDSPPGRWVSSRVVGIFSSGRRRKET